MMEDDYGDDDYFDEEDTEYEQAVLKAIETNKLNDLKRNFAVDSNVYDKAMGKRIDNENTEEKGNKRDIIPTTTATGLDTSIPRGGRADWSSFLEEDSDSSEVSAKEKKEGGEVDLGSPPL